MSQLKQGLEGIRVEAYLDVDFSTLPKVVHQWE